MEFNSISALLYLFLSLCCYYNKTFAEKVVREYSIDINNNNFDSGAGCNHSYGKVSLSSQTHPIEEPIKNRKRQPRVPLEKPFKGIFNCSDVTEYQCNKIKSALDFANESFSKALDFYREVIIYFDVSELKSHSEIAFTNKHITYSLKDPEEDLVYSYPIALTKQFLTDRPITFNRKYEYDIYIHFQATYITEQNHLEHTLCHEILHGLGFVSLLKLVRNGNIDTDFENFGNNYYMPSVLKLDDIENSRIVFNGFLPLGVYEKNFVEFQNPNHYFFTESFSSIAQNRDIFYTYHNPIYYSEKNIVKNFTSYVENWTGMNEGVEFFTTSHKPNTVAFKTNDNRLILLCTFRDGEDPDLSHLGSNNFIQTNTLNSNNTGRIDHNYLMYPYNVGLSMTAEEKIAKYGKDNKFGVLSDDIVSMLATMGYHRKGDPENNKIYEVVIEEVYNNKNADGIDDDPIFGNDGRNIKKHSKNAASHLSGPSPIISTFLIVLFTLLLLF